MKPTRFFFTALLVLAGAWTTACAVGSEPPANVEIPPAPSGDPSTDPDAEPPPPGDDPDTGPSEDTPPPPPPPDDKPKTGVAGQFDKHATLDGIDRSYSLYVPDSAMKGPAPLFVALHGAGDQGNNFVTAIGMKMTASKYGFVLVAPNAYLKAWFVSSAEGWTKKDGNTTSLQNDLALILRAIEDTKTDYQIDTKRIYLAGFSRGAGFTGGLATGSGNAKIFAGKYASPFAAYAVDAGYDMFSGVTGFDMSASSPKRPVWIIHGTSDGAVPFAEGQKLKDRLDAAGWPATFTSVSGAPHNWLWHSMYGHSNDELWEWMSKNALP